MRSVLLRRTRRTTPALIAAAAVVAWTAVAAVPSGAVTGPSAALPPMICTGDGVSGNRVQVVYTYETTDHFSERESIIRHALWEIQTNVNDTAKRAGQQRFVKFLHDANCQPVIIKKQVPVGTSSIPENLIGWLENNAGYTAPNRMYLTFSQEGPGCGDTEAFNDSTKSASNNLLNISSVFTIIGGECWLSGGAPTHEFAHGIGGLDDNADDPADHAPHNDPTSPGHCTDGNEALCKDKTGNGTGPCPDPLASRFLDCGGDDYFGFNPQPGNWLYDHFNAATDSRYLLAGSPVTPVTTYTPLPPQNLRAVDVQGTSIAFSFEQPGFYWGITRYELLQNTFIVATIPPTESTVTITGLQPNTQAPYRVRSVRETPTGTVYSALSQPITVTNNTSTTLAGAPVNGSVSVITNDARDTANPSNRLAIVPAQANVIQDGQKIWQGVRHDEDNPFSQRWRLQTATTTPTVTYNLKNFYSDLCLDVDNASQASGAQIVQRTCGTAARQRWTLVPVGTTTYQLRNANSNLCIQAGSPTAVVAWQLVQSACSTSQPTQRWTFNRFS